MSHPEFSPAIVATATRLQTLLCEMDPAIATGILSRDMLGLRRACGLPDGTCEGLRNRRGTARFLRFADGWAVMNLARPEDHDLIAALTQGRVESDAGLQDWAASSLIEGAAADAVDLGLAFSALPGAPATCAVPYNYRPSGIAMRSGPVVNLSGLWAGPLAGRILADAGFDVRRLRATSRPEPCQEEWARCFDALLHERQSEIVVSHLTHPVARDLLDYASVIITASRCDSLTRAGIAPRADQIWLRITAYGADAPNARRVGYGDDVGAAAGGALWGRDGMPRFQGDAFPDPLTGMIGAFALLQACQNGQGGIIDVSLHDAAAWALGGGEVFF